VDEHATLALTTAATTSTGIQLKFIKINCLEGFQTNGAFDLQIMHP
jgi:hypothetical protein